MDPAVIARKVEIVGLDRAGGMSQFSLVGADSTNATVIKASEGRVFGYSISNSSGAALYVKLYNKATAPDQNDVPVRRICIPAGQTAQYHAPAGMAGFTAGIGLRTTTGALDDDNAAPSLAALLINIDYA